MSVKYHINPETGRPNICRAKTPESCLYYNAETSTPAPHFDNKVEARRYAEKGFEEKYQTQPLQKISPRVKELLETVKNAPKEHQLTVEEVSKLGEEFNEVVKERTGLDLDGSLSSEEFREVGKANRGLIKELFSTGDLDGRVIRGNRNHKYHLEEALKHLPDNAHKRVKGDIHLKIERNTTGFGGTYRRGAEAPVLERRNINNDHPAGTFFSTDYYFDDENIIGQRIKKSMKNKGELVGGENVKPHLSKLPDETFIKLLREDIIDINGRLEKGKGEQLEAKYPELAETLKNQGVVEEYYLGKRPTGSKGEFFKKVADEVVVNGPNGKRKTFNKPLYKIYKKGIDFSNHTITGTKYADSSTMLHEYSHLLQTSRIPTEKEMFKKLTENAPIGKKSFYEFYEGAGADEYMFSTTGKELFTRATEGFYYPESNKYLYGEKNRAKEIRNWITGVWLILGR